MNNVNLSQLDTHSREIVAAERTAAFWVHEMRWGRMTRRDVLKRLDAMAPEMAELHREALNKFRRWQVAA